MEHKTKTYNQPEEESSMAKEPMPMYRYKTVPMSHVQMSFGLDVPTNEDLETLKLRIIAFAEYISSRERHSTRDKAIRQINKLMLLEDNWDGYGSPQVDAAAAKNAINIVSAMTEEWQLMLRIAPTETGSVSLRLIRGTNDSFGINCEKASMSYFIEREGNTPEFFSSVKYNAQNIETLMRRIEEW